MTTFRSGLIFALTLTLAGCGSTSNGDGGGGAGGASECPPDEDNCAILECPSTEDPAVHYISEDPAQCEDTDCGGPDVDCVPCADNQEYFDNECGCGCIDVGPGPTCPDATDPAVHYISEDPAQCEDTDCGGPDTDCIPCADHQEYFDDACGCGCIDVAPATVCPSESDPAVHYISTDPAQCEDMDCGIDVDCIPCEGDQEYFDNECGCGCIDPS